MRYERKYRIPAAYADALRQHIREHPLAFREAYPDRRVLNLYYDTLDHQYRRQNLEGQGIREKVRVRWYGEMGEPVQGAVLEFKSRDFALGDKKQHALGDFAWEDWPALTRAVAAILPWPQVQPVLFNAYQRSYLESWDSSLRLTLDSDLGFWNPDFSIHPLNGRQDPVCILEIKHETGAAAPWERWVQDFRLRPERNSKYVNGMALVSHF